MTIRTLFAAGAAAIAAAAAPAAAQYQQQAYPQPVYPQQAYPQQPVYPQPVYPQQSYPGYNQGYGTGNPITDVIDQLLGKRYNVTDRQAIRQCADAARVRAAQQYGAYGQQGYGQGGYNDYNGYNGRNQQFAAPSLRVSSITNVERRSNGLRVSGLMSTGYAGNQYGNQYGGQYGYQNRATGDVSFRCNVDYRGAVTNVRIGRNGEYRRY